MPRNSKHRFYTQTKKVWKSPKEYLEKGVVAATVAGTIVLATPVINADAGIGVLVPKLNTENPLKAGVSDRNNNKPAVVDIDADGDLDVFLGGYDDSGGVTFHKNTGSASEPQFTEQIKGDNPFNFACGSRYYPYYFGGQSDITFVDIDADSDLDAFIGRSDGTIDYFKNTGTASAPVFEKQYSSANPFNINCGTNYSAFDFSSYSSPAFADVDGDGDFDAFVGTISGNIQYLINEGTSTAPVFSVETGTGNPFNGVNVGSKSSPDFADIDSDGDLDAFIGNSAGEIRFFENTGSSTTPSYTERTGAASITGTIDIGNDSSPEFADIDGDGDLDLVIGEEDIKLNVFENTGTSTAPQFTEQADFENIYSGVDSGYNSRVTFADIDGDGDMDAAVGGVFDQYYGDGQVTYYENTGTPETPLFATPENADNPLMQPNCGTYYSQIYGANPAPFFSDIDGDGDLDLLIGNYYNYYGYYDPYTTFYENTGTAQAPVFREPNDADNPFLTPDTSGGYDPMTFGEFIPPVFADIDGDGDLDVFGGEGDYSLALFTNNGAAGSGAAYNFTTPPAEANPFRYQDASGNYQNLEIAPLLAPAFEDIDGDGDLDAVIGDYYGGIKYFQNTGTTTAALFAEQTGVNNPFDGISVVSESAPAFVDIDNDGDKDLFVGQENGTFSHYKNMSYQPADIVFTSVSAKITSPAVGTVIGTFTATDNDHGETLTFSLVSGTGDTDNSLFSISGNSLITATTPDLFKEDSSIRVRVEDSVGYSSEQVLTASSGGSGGSSSSCFIDTAGATENSSKKDMSSWMKKIRRTFKKLF